MDGFQLAFEILKILNKTNATPGLRTEVYCQLIKQLTGNPSEMSVSLGWELMAILLYYVLPEEDFINYLIVFLWNHAPTPDKSFSKSFSPLDSSRSSTTAIIPPSTSATVTTKPAIARLRAPLRRSASFCRTSPPILAATASRTSSLPTTPPRSSPSPTAVKKAEPRPSPKPPNRPNRPAWGCGTAELRPALRRCRRRCERLRRRRRRSFCMILRWKSTRTCWNARREIGL